MGRAKTSRRLVQLSAALVAVGALAGAASGGGNPPSQISGIVRPPSQILIGDIVHSPGFSCTPLVVGPCTLLKYHGGPVMKQQTNYTIFWVPSGYSVDGGYISTINQFFQDLQSDSGLLTNVYGVATQYCDGVATNATNCNAIGGGNITTNQTYGGTWTDTAAFPANGCSDPLGFVAKCLSTAQLEAEVQKAITANGWTHDISHMFFLYTPLGTTNCDSGSVCAYNYYCAFHSYIGTNTSSTVIWANQPYPSNGHSNYECGTGELPNGTLADESLITTSHEANEAYTDPIYNPGAWWDNGDNTGGENGDKCAWFFGTSSGPNGAKYNQTIHSHHYYVQLEWSNQDNDCLASFSAPAQPVPVITSMSPTSGIDGTKVTLKGTNFGGTTAVKFHGVNASSFTLKGTTLITAVVPPTATTGVVVVTNGGGDSTTGGTFTILPPQITKITPSHGPVGQPVTFAGKNLVGISAVAFNATAASEFHLVKGKTLIATVGAGTTSGAVHVTTPGGTANGPPVFTVDPSPVPTVKSFKPTSGHVGAIVTISGTGFYGTSSVTINGTACGSVVILGSTKLTCMVGGGTTTGMITVTTPGGPGMSTGNFTVLP